MPKINKGLDCMKWFKHPTDSRDKDHIIEILNEMGPQGYYIYFTLLELMHEKMDPKNNIIFFYHDTLAKLCKTHTKVIVKFNDFLEKILPGVIVKRSNKDEKRSNKDGYDMRQVPEIMQHFFLDLDLDLEEEEKKEKYKKEKKEILKVPAKKVTKKLEQKIEAKSDTEIEGIEPAVLTLLPQSQLRSNLNNLKTEHPLVTIWNTHCGDFGKVMIVSPSRLVKIKKAWATCSDVESWKLAIDKISVSGFCLGENDRGWRANFDWLIRPDTLSKILEGVYDKSANNTAPFSALRVVNDWEYQ